jgi:hypothetical protein
MTMTGKDQNFSRAMTRPGEVAPPDTSTEAFIYHSAIGKAALIRQTCDC